MTADGVRKSATFDSAVPPDFEAPMTTTPRPKRDESSLLCTLGRWERKIAALQRRHPGRWSVRGWSDGEVRDALTLCLFEALRLAHPSDESRFDPSPKNNGDPEENLDDRVEDSERHDEWEFALLTRHLRELQRGSRLKVTVMDLSDAPVMQREPSHEERYFEYESDVRRALAAQRAREGLSQPQRRWLAAMQWSANRGDFFEASERLNLSAASRVIGRHRSSALRVYKELQSRFQDELDRLE